MPNTPFLLNIRTYIAEGDIQKALDELKKMADQLNVSALMDEHATLSGQYSKSRGDYSRGIIEIKDLNLVINAINYKILDLLNRYNRGELMETIGSRGNNTGRIVHNIPSRMKPLEETFCSVRIAKDDETLLKGFPLSDISEPESLAISRTMSVELVDPMGGEIFQIRRITPEAKQRIDQDSFTEWDFAITPLKQGKYTLWLYATTNVEGSKKALKFFKNIEISTEEIEQGRTWELTNMIVENTEKKNSNFPIIGSWPYLSAATKVIMLSLAITALGYAAYLLSRPQKMEPVLKIDNQLQVTSVEIDGKVITNWTSNADTTNIILPEQEMGRTYSFVVKGKNGYCEKQFALSKDSLVIPMECIILPEKINPVLVIDNELKVQVITVDGLALNGWIANADTTEINLPLMEVGKKYVFEVVGSNGNCKKEVVLSKESVPITLQCDIDPTDSPTQLFDVKLRVRKDVFGNFDLQGLRVWIEQLNIDLIPSSFGGDYVVFNASNLQIGAYLFKLNGFGYQATCPYIETTINSNVTLDFDCTPADYFSVTLKVPKTAFPNGGFSQLRLRLDGILQNIQPQLESAGKFAFFHLGQVKRGSRKFEVVNVNSNFPCSLIEEVVDTAEILEFTCISIID